MRFIACDPFLGAHAFGALFSHFIIERDDRLAHWIAMCRGLDQLSA
jgi:hypothetical protein